MPYQQNRREFVTSLLGLACFPAVSFANTIELGEMKIHSVSDGNLRLPTSFLFPDVDKNSLKALLIEHGLDTEQFKPECNLTYLENGDRKILFDAGAGPNFMSSAGKLFENLEGDGIDPSAITDVIFTHGHPDHIWGIVDDFDEISFPDATLHFPRQEWDFWRAEDTLELMDDTRKPFVVGARNRMEMMEDRISLHNAGDEIVSGVEAVDTSGHTPGHMSYAIHNGSENVLVIGDAITNHIVSFLKPEWPSGSDQDTAKGIETRTRLLDRAANENTTIIGYHLPNGGVGRVEKSNGAYRFIQ